MTSETLPLRKYQAACIEKIEAAWRGGMRYPAATLPTGAGKTVIFAHLAKQAFERDGMRSFVVVHTDELVQQAVSKLHSVAPHMKIGVVQGQRNEVHADTVVGTIQTLRARDGYRLDRIAQRGPWLTIVDECHHATAASYRAAIAALSPPDRGGRAVGFTATMARGDGASLGEVWDDVVYRHGILEMIKDGWLLPMRGKRIRVPDFSLIGVHRTAGDYRADEIGDRLSAALAPEIVAQKYVELASDRKGVLFAPTVASAYEFEKAFIAAGIPTETVHGGLAKDERRGILRRLRTGETQVVSNCMVLTEGFDEPSISCAVIARPTTIPGLYTQMVGRIARLHPGLTDALVLDVVGAAGRHKLASLVDLVGDPTLTRDIPEDSLADLLIDEDGLQLFDDEPTRTVVPHDIEYVSGEVEVVDVDLFARSHHAWLQTLDGSWFLPGRITVFIAPDGPDTMCVAMIDSLGRGMVPYRGIELDAAMTWGEELARKHGDATLLNRKAAWRRRNDAPTSGQRSRCATLGIEIDPFASKADVANMISVHTASRLVDPIVKRWSGHHE